MKLATSRYTFLQGTYEIDTFEVRVRPKGIAIPENSWKKVAHAYAPGVDDSNSLGKRVFLIGR